MHITLRSFYAIAVILLIGTGCGKQQNAELPPTKEVESAKYIEMTSQLGNKLVCPDFWQSVDEGQNWSVGDGQGGINIYTVTAEGSGSLEEFRDMVVASVDDIKGTDSPGWEDVENNNWKGTYALFDAKDDSGTVWQIIIATSGKYYHSIRISVPKLAYDLNKGMYKDVAMTFASLDDQENQ